MKLIKKLFLPYQDTCIATAYGSRSTLLELIKNSWMRILAMGPNLWSTDPVLPYRKACIVDQRQTGTGRWTSSRRCWSPNRCKDRLRSGQQAWLPPPTDEVGGITTGGCMSKGTKKAKIHHFSGYASNFKSSIYVIKLLKTNSSR